VSVLRPPLSISKNTDSIKTIGNTFNNEPTIQCEYEYRLNHLPTDVPNCLCPNELFCIFSIGSKKIDSSRFTVTSHLERRQYGRRYPNGISPAPVRRDRAWLIDTFGAVRDLQFSSLGGFGGLRGRLLRHLIAKARITAAGMPITAPQPPKESLTPRSRATIGHLYQVRENKTGEHAPVRRDCGAGGMAVSKLPRKLGTTYTHDMPTPVGPVPPDPDDPDTWDWGEFPDERNRRKPLWQLVLISVVVMGLVLLLVVNIL
jgi:hypothetical protein